MGQEILKNWQKKVIGVLLAESDFKNFYLSGGTALAAYYLNHRISDDLDFFSQMAIEPIALHNLAKIIKEKLNIGEMRFSKIYDRNLFFYSTDQEEFKIEFTQYPFSQLELPETFDGLSVDSKYDIAVNKLAAVLDRFDPKDFVDLYFLLQDFSLADLRNGLEKKFGLKAEPVFLGSELMKVRRITALPKMIKSITADDLIEFFTSEAKKLAPEILK